MLTRDQVKLLWHDRFWDYPRSGALELDGKRYWFEEHGDDTGIFDIIDLPEQTWAGLDERHRDFQENVGTHCDYDAGEANVRKLDSTVKPREQWHLFYDKYEGVPEIDIFGIVIGQWGFEIS